MALLLSGNADGSAKCQNRSALTLNEAYAGPAASLVVELKPANI